MRRDLILDRFVYYALAVLDDAVSGSAWLRARWKPALALVTLIAGLALYGPVGGSLGSWFLARKVRDRLALGMDVGRARLTLSGLVLHEVAFVPVARPGREETPLPPLQVQVTRIAIPFAAAFGGGEVQVEGPSIRFEDALSRVRDIQAHLSNQAASHDVAPEGALARKLPRVVVSGGSLEVVPVEGRQLHIQQLAMILAPDDSLVVDMNGCRGHEVGQDASEAAFGADNVHIELPLSGIRPSGVPTVKVVNGYAQVPPRIGLTGINGSLGPSADDQGRRVTIAFSGSYGGAQETLWHATGTVRPGKWILDSEGELSIRADRFSLGRIREVLPPSILTPERTFVDAALDLKLRGAEIAVSGSLDVVDLSVFHERLAREPVERMRMALDIEASVYPLRRAVEITSIDGRTGDLKGRITGSIELAEGTYAFEDGSKLPWLPRVDLTLDIPPMGCSTLLTSFPPALIPRLKGFDLQGRFTTHLKLHVDYADLENLELDGSVGIDGCRVLGISDSVAKLTTPDAIIVQEVEVPPAWNDRSKENELLSFVLGFDNPDFVALEDISVHLTNAILSTEDSRFFQHRGIAVREFKTALKRNLARGGFKLGASSISMQMVKNLLLVHDKTLSRKLQELFLTWYLEQTLTKERILELYLNAIEFGPRLYGIGPASRHYFGKLASELTPAEAAFIARLLPNPKKRYVHYCRGQISEKWQRLIKRTLQLMHERERLSAEELAVALETMPQFDLLERPMTEKQCLDWIQRITADREEEPGDDGTTEDVDLP